MLVRGGHSIVAMTRSAARVSLLESMGAHAVIGDVFDAPRLAEAVESAAPDIVIHQLTAFGAKDVDPLAETIRIRREGTATRLLPASSPSAGPGHSR